MITSDLENICEDLVRDGSGWTFRTGDSTDLLRVLTRLHGDPDLSLDKRPVARKAYLERYAPDVDLRRLEAIYAGVL